MKPDMSLLHIEARGQLPGPIAQRELDRLVLSNVDEKIKAAAALELAHQIQRNGLALTREVKEVEDLYSKTTDAKLKGNLALVLGSFRPDERATGTRLRDFRPAERVPARE